ncbi:nuclear transport factor 2 family protein [Burkholderia sp. Ac-20344]|uniref:nuclear transport factor 2 family protein n=1 Tax=Burkholderia sp. Ac-20344 TaxID=2703890 RepID=UPI00197C5218|nr:nuclear transport factor 2 family protein [Burkholderia sp. Ac-20344]MBN3834445.1 hypothetical protein [Burkholderia sp. Ac-20344]
MYETSISSARKWIELVNERSLETFAAAFTEDATLEATVLDAPVVGAAKIRRFFDATRNMYESLIFVHEASTDSHTYIAWEGVFAGNAVAGVTVLCRNASGVVSNIWLHHRPLGQVLAFSTELAAVRSGPLSIG